MVATTAPPGASLSPNSTPFKSTCTWADALVQGLKKGSAMHFCEKELVEGLCNLQGKSVMLPPSWWDIRRGWQLGIKITVVIAQRKAGKGGCAIEYPSQ